MGCSSDDEARLLASRALDTFRGHKPPQIGSGRSTLMDEVIQAGLAEPAGSFSLLALFWQAHIVVKLVIDGLLAASVWCWAIIVD